MSTSHPIRSLPKVILRYIAAANEGRIQDAADCFAENAQVYDEDRTHSGRDDIRKWIAEATREYEPKNDVVSAEADGEEYLVCSRVSGNFPGSPIELAFRFVITNDEIFNLEIQ